MSVNSVPPERYRLSPVVDTHADKSRRLILQAANSVDPKRAVVLGAGACEEVPLVALVDRFDHIVLNDLDILPLEKVIAETLSEDRRLKTETLIADITGQTDSILGAVERALSLAANVEDAIDGLAAAFTCVPNSSSPLNGKFDLVV